MLKIYGHTGSINVRKVLWLCEEIGLAFTREDWSGKFRSTAEPDFKALSPFGMIPVIDDGGFVLAESNAILRYVAASRARTDLLPTEAKGSRANRIMDGLAGVRFQQLLACRLSGTSAW